ncbi:hypothetical protein [Burkholderia sp. NLJ2]|uniref:hypothetical protein n=1 Tax=Burkholderia sp. NLJ2 TaxID=3090699 RepID=UPI003C6C76C6
MKFVIDFTAHDAAMTFFSFVPHLHDPNAFQNRQRDRDISARRPPARRRNRPMHGTIILNSRDTP